MGSCKTCWGRKTIDCPVCRGSGKTYVDGKPKPCHNCDGDRKVPCPACRGTGTE